MKCESSEEREARDLQLFRGNETKLWITVESADDISANKEMERDMGNCYRFVFNVFFLPHLFVFIVSRLIF